MNVSPGAEHGGPHPSQVPGSRYSQTNKAGTSFLVQHGDMEVNYRVAERPQGMGDDQSTEAGGVGSQPLFTNDFLPCPPSRSVFTGRSQELAAIRAEVDRLERERHGVAVVVLWGMAGVGKTALALTAAHELKGRFQGPKEFLNLRGYSDTRPTPTETLAALLSQVAKISASQIPTSQVERARLWRSWTSGRQTLLVLDNVQDCAHVQQVLPGDGKHLLLVTTRHRTGLHLLDCTPRHLEPPQAADALRMFRHAAGQDADHIEQDALAGLLKQCGHLPLAIRILAARLRGSSADLHRILAETSQAESPLQGLDDLCSSESLAVSALFEASYRHLPRSTQRVFRLLGLHPLGSDFSVRAAAALAGLSPTLVGRKKESCIGTHLQRLCDASLLDIVALPSAHHAEVSYTMHDLLVPFARGKVRPTTTHKAIDGMLDHYWRTALERSASAEPSLTRHVRPRVEPHQPPSRPAPTAGNTTTAPATSSRTEALAWYQRHRTHLLACLDIARLEDEARREDKEWSDCLDRWTIRLTSAMAGPLRSHGPWDQAAERHAEAADAARRIGDRPALAVALNDLGIINRLRRLHDDALKALSEAELIFSGELPHHITPEDKKLGQANALNEQGIVHNEVGIERNDEGLFRRAATLLQRALALYHTIGDGIGTANATKNLAVSLFHAGLLQQDARLRDTALRHLDTAGEGYRDVGDELGVVEVLNHRGILLDKAGDRREALADFNSVLEPARQVGSRLELAKAWDGISRCRETIGSTSDMVVQALEMAAEIYAEIGATAARRQVAARLIRFRRD
ncbi:tetratricopeptide repeat protein [Streptomyces sp. NBC_01481]|uniref:tetratricopeptide repeat protein n=1 Tax=Streptomyces sp. NBC_01481 TaxID=2975869 RepID=UPI00224F866D|nr:tetratricopeptide repeat protein [Streptomyces sp. NBC_01481]MCX4585985.1 NB-ARC domain-containing protein [Streptomyces sp. NBC_01481]